MDQISQIQLYIASITQLMIEDMRWMQTVTLTPGEAVAIQNLATKGTTGTQGVDSIAQPLNVYELNRAAEFQLSAVQRAERLISLIAECDAVISLLPAEFASEKEQLQELVELKKKFYVSEERLHKAEHKAAYYQKHLQNSVTIAGNKIHKTSDSVTRNDI